MHGGGLFFPCEAQDRVHHHVICDVMHLCNKVALQLGFLVYIYSYVLNTNDDL